MFNVKLWIWPILPHFAAMSTKRLHKLIYMINIYFPMKKHYTSIAMLQNKQ